MQYQRGVKRHVNKCRQRYKGRPNLLEWIDCLDDPDDSSDDTSNATDFVSRVYCPSCGLEKTLVCVL